MGTSVLHENRPAGRMYFTSEDDLHLLREVVGQYPYEVNTRWNVIQMNIAQIVGKFISVRTLKDRVKNLVNKFLEKDRTMQFKSGIEEEITELDDLLRHIVELINDFKDKKSMVCKKPLGKPPLRVSKKSKSDTSYQKGLEQKTLATDACSAPKEFQSSQTFSTHEQASPYEIIGEQGSKVDLYEIEITDDQEKGLEMDTNMTWDESQEDSKINAGNENTNNSKKLAPSARKILTPTRKRAASSLKQSTLVYLTRKNDRWFEIRSRELALQERDKSLQEKKMEFENWERRKKIVMDEKKLNVELDIFKNQQ